MRGLLFLIPSFIVLPAIFGNNGIWLALAASEILTSVSIVGYYFFKRRKEKCCVA